MATAPGSPDLYFLCESSLSTAVMRRASSLLTQPAQRLHLLTTDSLRRSEPPQTLCLPSLTVSLFGTFLTRNCEGVTDSEPPRDWLQPQHEVNDCTIKDGCETPTKSEKEHKRNENIDNRVRMNDITDGSKQFQNVNGTDHTVCTDPGLQGHMLMWTTPHQFTYIWQVSDFCEIRANRELKVLSSCPLGNDQAPGHYDIRRQIRTYIFRIVNLKIYRSIDVVF
ncbi:hypothetical protein RRG08_046974 [Elysia crispata]|uniref:Uncharacterized protein n=1 Tax=Elysia crispata TaxID=231223 RepID=A0AAE1DUU9_9GAST|nr:hypothetical protein RRG08_046974 [Elysia crispata]